MAVDLLDTRRCPLKPACENCGEDGNATGPLRTVIVDTPVGILCMALCGGCTDAEAMPSMGYPTAVDRVLQHCGHLGIDADQAERLHDALREADR
ncbi:hypothetical protein GCM10018962_77340 [Dactylosporangium matsuzakiense]|uniref:hypothetical protein n=1 Tax=Dactylosporangium matsuzakiense TaxID=53360 RepID=UPI0031F1A71B